MASTEKANASTNLWIFKNYKDYEWFKFLVLLLLGIAALYLLLHFFLPKLYEEKDKADYEYEKLDERQKQHINRIYFDTGNVNQEVVDSAAVEGEGAFTDTSQVEVEVGTGEKIKNTVNGSSNINPCKRAIDYIQNEFSNKVDSFQLVQIEKYLCSAPPLEAVSFLANVRLRVKSYFWLTGPEVYFEIIFWSLFGVLSSILYNLGIVSKDSTTVPNNPRTVFDSSEIPFQLAKLLYAPLCTLAIILGYNFFSDENIVDISSSKGVIAFSFVGGFFSSRLIAFLDRLKEVILPTSATPGGTDNRAEAPSLLKDISIELQLDETAVSEQQKLDLAEIGFGSAEVNLQMEEGGDLVTATRKGEDQSSTFTVNNIKPGTYIIKVKWSGQLDEELLNLEGEKTEQINTSKQAVAVLLKKSEDVG